jgi:hypothetical protein
MRDPRQELALVEGVQEALQRLRNSAEALPEGHSVRVAVETYLTTVEGRVDDEADGLRRSVQGRQG